MAKKKQQKKKTARKLPPLATRRKAVARSKSAVKKAQGNLNLKLKKHQQVVSAMHYSGLGGFGADCNPPKR